MYQTGQLAATDDLLNQRSTPSESTRPLLSDKEEIISGIVGRLSAVRTICRSSAGWPVPKV
jgi:hypothetical protein